MLPTASVVVPARNSAGTIDACIRSLLELDYPRDLLEIMVVDDGSRDRTPALLEAYGDQLTVIRQEPRGRAAARNAGVLAARGEVIAFTDADCTVEPPWLTELVNPLFDPSVGIVGGGTRAHPGANPAERYAERIHDNRPAILVWRPPFVASANWASRREVLEEAGLFDETFVRGSDVDLSWRIGALGYTLVYRPEAIVRHTNSRTALGLFLDGSKQGFHGVRLRRMHAAYIAAAKATGQEPELDEPDDRSIYDLAFQTGKRLGQVAGRLFRR